MIRIHSTNAMHAGQPLFTMCAMLDLAMYISERGCRLIHQLTPPPPDPPLRMQSHGRALAVPTCKQYIIGDAGCAASFPTLALTSGADTKWIFEPAGNGDRRYFIRMNVSFRPARGRPRPWPPIPQSYSWHGGNADNSNLN